MRLQLLATAIVVLFVSMQAVAAPLSAGDLATPREINPRYGTATPSDAALEGARKIGREKNIDGLRTVIEMHNPSLLGRAIESFDLSSSRVLPEPLEALIVEYADRDAYRQLLAFIARGLDKNGRFPQYRSRKLFDLLYADLKSNRNESFHYAILIVATDLKGIEPQLVAVLPMVGAAAANELVMFLGLRRYAPAVPALRALQADTPFARDTNGLLGHINGALLQIGTPDAVQAVLDRLTALGKQSAEPRAMSEIAGILSTLTTLPADTQPDYAILRAALPKELAPYAQQSLVKLIVTRKDKRGLPDLTLAVARGNDEALTALLALGASGDWRVAKGELEQAATEGTVKPERMALLQKRLDAALADPSRFIAERGDAERRQAFTEARAQLDRQNTAVASLRESDPKRYAAETEIYLRRAEKLIADNAAGRQEAIWYRRDISQAYQRLATYTRFTLRDSARAVTFYERAIALSETFPARENMGLLERVGLADTVRFDLKDTRRALQIYAQLLQRVSGNQPSTNDIEAVFQRVLTEWLRAEIAFLAEGKRYAGTPDRETFAGIAMVVYYGAEAFTGDDPSIATMAKVLHTRSPRNDEKRDFARQLEALSPSQARLLGAFDFLPLLGSPGQVGVFMRKHDPAGFLTACAFAIWHLFEQETANKAIPREMLGMRVFTWSATDREVMRQAETAALGRLVVVNAEADPRLTSPESTWKTFVDALRVADLGGAWKCTTPGIRNKFERNFRAMTPAQLKEMADSTVGFKRYAEFGEFVEAVVVRANGHAGAVTFVRQGKEWRISEM